MSLCKFSSIHILLPLSVKKNPSFFCKSLVTFDLKKFSSSFTGTARIQVDLDFTSPIIQTSTSTYSTCSSSSARSTDAPSTTTISTTSMPFQRTRQLAQKCLQETSRIVRSASSSSMNILSNFKLNRSSRYSIKIIKFLNTKWLIDETCQYQFISLIIFKPKEDQIRS